MFKITDKDLKAGDLVRKAFFLNNRAIIAFFTL